jgi:hypothetical protein
LLAFLLFATSACGDDEPVPEASATGRFAAPEGVAAAGDLVVVASSAFTGSGFGDGFVTVVDTASDAVVATAATSQKNPQFIAVMDDAVVVVCTGETRYLAAEGMNVALGPGAVDVFTRSELRTATGPALSISIPPASDDPRRGGPGSVVVLPDGKTAYVASGLSAVVFKADLASGALLRGADDPIVVREHDLNDTLTLARHPSGVVLVASYGTNAIYSLDPATDTVGDPIDVGLTSDLEGVIDLAVRPEEPDVVYVATIANALGVLSLAAGQAGVTPALASTGATANAVVVDGDVAYVVNSGENNIQRTPLSDPGATSRPFAVLPVASNPWDMAVVGRKGYVSLFRSNRLAVIDLDTGALLREID